MVFEESCSAFDSVTVHGHEVLKALEAVHAVGLLHRDIKLDNVLVDTSAGKGREVARLIDFDQAATSVMLRRDFALNLQNDLALKKLTPAL